MTVAVAACRTVALAGPRYVIGGHGAITVLDARRTHLAVLGEVPSSVGARTGCWFAERDALYVAAPAVAGAPARLLVYHAP